VRSDRRAKILEAATELFRERGFHAVGVDEIGEAAGITGPGVYRHFAGKDDLLVSVFDAATDDLWEGPEGGASLEDYVASHVDYAIDHAHAIELWYQERRHLPTEAQAKQRRIQRRYVVRWVTALRAERPELDEDGARLRCQAAIGLIHSFALGGEVGKRELVVRMALAALRVA
jgi:AcrR family transcriptional regulator